MNKIIAVKPLTDYQLELLFSNKETRFFDVKPYLDFGIFTELKNETYFKTVTIQFNSVTWQNGQDFSPETLYLKSIPA